MSELLFSAGGEPSAPFRSRRSRRSARAWNLLAAALIAIGGLALIDAGVTLVWQEPISALIAKLRQDHLSGTLHRLESAGPTLGELRRLASLPDERARVQYLAEQFERTSTNGSAVGRIVIPHIGADYVVVKGTDTDDLKSGPGVYPETHFPGIAGTTAIAGHRTTYLAPFRNIDSLRPGDHILLEMPYAHFTYTVIGQRVVLPTDVNAAIGEVGYTRLVLSACTPLFSASHRLLVYASLTRTVPVGEDRYMPGGELTRPIETPAPVIPVVAPLQTLRSTPAEALRSAPPVLVPLKATAGAVFI